MCLVWAQQYQWKSKYVILGLLFISTISNMFPNFLETILSFLTPAPASCTSTVVQSSNLHHKSCTPYTCRWNLACAEHCVKLALKAKKLLWQRGIPPSYAFLFYTLIQVQPMDTVLQTLLLKTWHVTCSHFKIFKILWDFRLVHVLLSRF